MSWRDYLPDHFKESGSDYDGVFSYAAEWHAFSHGVYDGLTTRPRRWSKHEKPDNKDVEKEPHYYKGGFVIGSVIQIGAIAGLTAGGLSLL